MDLGLQISFVSEPGDRLSDLGGGRVMIRNPDKPDRILNRLTGEIRPASEFHNIGRDIAAVVIPFVVFAVAALWLSHAPKEPTPQWLLEMQRSHQPAKR